MGTVIFPREYPDKPPSIYMTTPNGRFRTNTRLCLSMSDFHPELWNPLWRVGSILTGLLSFMVEESNTTGAVAASAAERRRLARASLATNAADPVFRALFPDLLPRCELTSAPESASVASHNPSPAVPAAAPAAAVAGPAIAAAPAVQAPPAVSGAAAADDGRRVRLVALTLAVAVLSVLLAALVSMQAGG